MNGAGAEPGSPQVRLESATHARRALTSVFRQILLLDHPSRPDHFFAISGVTSLLWTGSSIIIPMLPLYTESIGLSHTQAGIVIGAFYAGRLGLNMFGGRLVQSMGLRPIAVTGCAISAIAAISAGVIDGFIPLTIARVAQGAGAGLFLTAALTSIVRTTEPTMLGRYTALYQGIGMFGSIIGPVVGGLLGQFVGLGAPFFGYAVMAGVGVIVSLTKIAGRPAPTVDPTIEGASSGSMIRRVSAPNLLTIGLISNYLVFALRSGILHSLIPLLGLGVLGMSITNIGLTFSVATVGNVIVMNRAGRRADSDRRLALLLGMSGSGIFVVAAGLAPSAAWLVVACTLAMTATGYASVVPTILAVDGTHASHQGYAIGLTRVAADIALLTGPVLAGMLSDGYGLRVGIAIPGVLVLLVTLLSSFKMRSHTPPSSGAAREGMRS